MGATFSIRKTHILADIDRVMSTIGRNTEEVGELRYVGKAISRRPKSK
jgi:hypothetical protein